MVLSSSLDTRHQRLLLLVLITVLTCTSHRPSDTQRGSESIPSVAKDDGERQCAQGYDIILYGATGFTGQLVARYLDTVPTLSGRCWAISGRNLSKLQSVKAALNHPLVDVLPAELSAGSAKKLVGSTRVVLNCAGPYSQAHGELLLGACARAGVHYADLSGESFWQGAMAAKYNAVANASGAKIIIGAGVDSIPSDLGTMLALGALPNSAADGSIHVTSLYMDYLGAFSGGTLKTDAAEQEARRLGTLTTAMDEDPYLVCPPGTTGADSLTGTADGMPADFGFGLHAIQPFFMAGVNARIVRRSLTLHGLQGHVSYREASSTGLWLHILWVYLVNGLGYFRGEPICFAPQSGEGPPRWLLREGSFRLQVTARSARSGVATMVVVDGKGDPGYGATAKMLAEVGLSLSFDLDQSEASAVRAGTGGVLTPWIGLGELLVSRLQRAEGGQFMSFVIHAAKTL